MVKTVVSPSNYNLTMPSITVSKIAEADFPSRWGHFRVHGFEGVESEPEPCKPGDPVPPRRVEGCVALVLGDIHAAPPLVRIHSQCLTGDVFGSLRCDCRQQFELAMERIVAEGAGILIYEQQEGRGIGLMGKLRAYELQDEGLDTIQANLELGYKADCRIFEVPAKALKLLNVHSVRLMTNNPEKIAALEEEGIRVVERISAEVPPASALAERYLKTKHMRMGHLFTGTK
jgi:GTP cyclohydrolase II